MCQAAIQFAWRDSISLRSSGTMSLIIARMGSVIDKECGAHSAIPNARRAAKSAPSGFVHLETTKPLHRFVLFAFCKEIAFSSMLAELPLEKERELWLFPKCGCFACRIPISALAK